MKTLFALLVIVTAFAGSGNIKNAESADKNNSNFIDANKAGVNADFTKLTYYIQAEESSEFERHSAVEPPLIPHTTAGFFPIKADRNICLECHLPDKADEFDATSVPEWHLSDVRPQLVLVDGVYHNPPNEVKSKKLNRLNYAFFNCSQCHVPQEEIDVDITDLLTPEMIKKFDLPVPADDQDSK